MWKDILGWEGLYEVSDAGEVRNKLTGHLLVGDMNSAGYYRVCLYNKHHTPRKQRFFRHRLVATHFIPTPNNYPEVNHKHGDKSVNTADELEWCTRTKNERHCRRTLRSKPYKPFFVVFDDHTIKIFDHVAQLEELIGVPRANITHWLHNRSHSYHKYGIHEIMYIFEDMPNDYPNAV